MACPVLIYYFKWIGEEVGRGEAESVRLSPDFF